MGFDAIILATGAKFHVYSVLRSSVKCGYTAIGYDRNTGTWFEITLDEIQPIEEI